MSDWINDNERSWYGFDEPDAERLSRFQKDLYESLIDNPNVKSIELVIGSKENYFHGGLSQFGSQFYIYLDRTEFDDKRYERWDYKTREELKRTFLEDISKAANE